MNRERTGVFATRDSADMTCLSHFFATFFRVLFAELGLF
jgi:hypothetical protein